MWTVLNLFFFSLLFIFMTLVFVQAVHFNFNVVISNSFNFIFDTDFLRDRIN